jgi:hypothetical protein
MVSTSHSGLPMAALHDRSPPPYTFVTSNLNFLSKIWSKSVVHSPDPFKNALKRAITNIPPSITTTHHDGSLPSPFALRPCQQRPSPPFPSTLTQRLMQNLRDSFEMTARQNGNGRQCSSWTNWKQ